MYKLNIIDMLGLLGIMLCLGGIMALLTYFGVDLSAPLSLPTGDSVPYLSPTGAMSGTIS